MAAKSDLPNKERKFVSLLSSRLKKEKYSFEETELDALFDDALSNLPNSDLKTGLKKCYDEHLKKLKNILLDTKKPPEETVVDQTQSQFSFYDKDEICRFLDKVKTARSNKDKEELYKILWSCFPFLKDSQKVLESLQSETDDSYSMIEKCLRNTVGCLDKKSILKSLKFLLSVFSAEYETCIADDKSSKNLQALLLQSIMSMNHRWKSCIDRCTGDETETPEDTYEDMMAAMLSLYTDLLIASSLDDSAVDNLASLLFIILGHSSEHCMDVLLQVTQPISKLSILARCILERNQGTQSHIQYIKFVCLSRAAITHSSSETLAFLHKVAESQQASSGFIGFLFQTNKRLAKRLGLTKKMNISQVTAHLLADSTDGDMDSLLDIATDQHDRDSAHEDKDDIEMELGDQTSADQLFFIDSSGGIEDTEDKEVEVEENKAIDSILYKQMKLMAEQTEDSDSEDEGDILQEPTSPVTVQQHPGELEAIQETEESQEPEHSEDKQEEDEANMNEDEEEIDNNTTKVSLRKSKRRRTLRKY